MAISHAFLTLRSSSSRGITSASSAAFFYYYTEANHGVVYLLRLSMDYDVSRWIGDGRYILRRSTGYLPRLEGSTLAAVCAAADWLSTGGRPHVVLPGQTLPSRLLNSGGPRSVGSRLPLLSPVPLPETKHTWASR